MIACLLKGVTNFVIYKFGHLVANEWQTMYDLAKMFLHCLNHWKLDTPTARKQQQQGQADDLALYRVNYTRLFFLSLQGWLDIYRRYIYH